MLFWRCRRVCAVEETDSHARYPARASPIMWPSVDHGVLPASQRCGLADPSDDLLNRAVVRATSQASKAADWILSFLEPDGPNRNVSML